MGLFKPSIIIWFFILSSLIISINNEAKNIRDWVHNTGAYRDYFQYFYWINNQWLALFKPYKSTDFWEMDERKSCNITSRKVNCLRRLNSTCEHYGESGYLSEGTIYMWQNFFTRDTERSGRSGEATTLELIIKISII